MTSRLVLRDVVADDLPIFFHQQLDPDANYMAAFTAKDPAATPPFWRTGGACWPTRPSW